MFNNDCYLSSMVIAETIFPHYIVLICASLRIVTLLDTECNIEIIYLHKLILSKHKLKRLYVSNGGDIMLHNKTILELLSTIIIVYIIYK